MTNATIVNVNLLIAETGEGEIADAVSGILTDQMRCYIGQHSSLLDWRHTHKQLPVEIDAEYKPDESPSPFPDQLPSPSPDAMALLRELVAWERQGFEDDDYVDGGDAVAFLAEFRLRVKALLNGSSAPKPEGAADEKHFLVSWEIDIIDSADNAGQAAAQALIIMRDNDPDNIATVFTVRDMATGEAVQVDLSE